VASLFIDYHDLFFFSPLPDNEKMTSRWQKFRLLMWKNYLITRRHLFQTILEIAIPVLLSALLVYIRSVVKPEIHPDPLHFPALGLANITDTL
jgi:ATP-binding cassette, subfamily A (ABC1), member 3